LAQPDVCARHKRKWGRKQCAFSVLLAAVGVVVAAAVAAAQDDAASYPNRPIRIIVPFAAGGTTDVLARIVGQALTAKWGQPVIIENRAGAGATLGADMVAKSPSDGYTLLMGATHHTIAQSAYARVPYHFGRDFSPITVIALVPNMVVVNAKVPARTVEEFIALAKQKPGSLNYGTAGAGTAHHLIGEMFKLEGDGHRPHTLSWKCTCADRFDRGSSAGNVR
jgi:tripartite-type tricarboxylate transporter receptor subunit TctC